MHTPTHPDIDTDVAARLQRVKGSWSVVAEQSGVSYSWISQYMRGLIHNAGVDTLRKVRAALEHIESGK